MTTPTQYSPLAVAIALSLYAYNVSPDVRAKKLYDHFAGACLDLEDLVRAMEGNQLAYAATELPIPTARVYVQHALDRYGQEAQSRILMGML